MKIQLAIDRVSLEEANRLAREVGPFVDIVEVGTSLIKEFGISSVASVKKSCPDTAVLADLKTMDEGAYEFRCAYRSGADIATVMGVASLPTIQACAQVAREEHREYMIDLMEVPEEKITVLTKDFPDAVFCVHLPADRNGTGLQDLMEQVRKPLCKAKRLALAGGITLDGMEQLNGNRFEIAIVGGAITKSQNPVESARKFCRLAK